MSNDVLLSPWSGPFGGVPPLDRVEVSQFEPALRTAMAEKRAQAWAIRDDPAPPTFANTFVPLERMGVTLDRVRVIYGLWSANYSSPEVRAVRQRMEPDLAVLRDEIHQDPILFARMQAAAAAPDLDPQQRRLCDGRLRAHRRAGAHLDAADRQRVAEINVRLAVLYNDFSDRLLADEEGYVTFLDASQLGGLADGFLAGAAAAAEAHGRPGSWAITNTRSSAEPFLASSTDRSLREVVWRNYFGRGDQGDANDTNDLVAEVVALRQERAILLGMATHAHLQLEDTMAGTPDRARHLLAEVWPAAKAKFEAEVAEMQSIADARGDAITIAPWDVRFYAALAQVGDAEEGAVGLQAYYDLDQLRQGMFWTAEARFGWRFEAADLPVPHPSVTAWSVHNADGSPRGVFYFDPFARPGKRSGAWMASMRVQHCLDGAPVLPIVSNNCNFIEAPAGQPTQLTSDQLRTLFHEFGHALHGLASDVTYPSLSGTAVPRDYVEFPSQLNEHWGTTPEVLSRFARHPTTGEPPSSALLAEGRATENATSGFRTMEYLASAVVDLALHTHDGPVDPRQFEAEILEQWDLPPQVVMRHRIPQFAHLFSGESYSAGYYCYLWADVLTADAAEAFADAGFYDPEMTSRLMDTVLSRGNTVDPAGGYRAFRGRDPEVAALLRDRGFASA